MKHKKLELMVPSQLGNERYAMQFAEGIAADMGFASEKIENLKIAVGEACLNAIEHGNKLNKNMMVTIDFNVKRTELEIRVQDRGDGYEHEKTDRPDINCKVGGSDSSLRGWGLYLIENMVDEMEYIDGDSGTQLRIVLKLPGA